MQTINLEDINSKSLICPHCGQFIKTPEEPDEMIIFDNHMELLVNEARTALLETSRYRSMSSWLKQAKGTLKEMIQMIQEYEETKTCEDS